MNNNMKRWTITAMIMTVMFVAIVGTSSADQRSGITQPNYWGNKIGSFEYNGVTVDAFSNGNSIKGPLYDSHSYSAYGLQYQCTEYVNRFYAQALGKDLYSVYKGNANGYFSRASQFRLVAYKNGGTTPPQMGDIICSNGVSGVNVGHVAIVRQVIDNPTGVKSIRVIHQNWANVPSKDKYGAWIYNPDANYKELTMKKINGKYTVNSFGSGYPVTGWLHKQN
jgi:CHAP domain